MLRGKETVWMETVAWPGLPGGAGDDMGPADAGASKPGDKIATPSDKSANGAKPAKPAPKPAKKAAEDDTDDPFAVPAPAKKKD